MITQAPCNNDRCTIEEIVAPPCKAFVAILGATYGSGGERVCFECWHLESCHKRKAVE